MAVKVNGSQWLDQVRRVLVGDFGTIPARKSGDGYEQACGHTRVEALRRMGATHVEVTVHDYDDEKMLAVMTAENATQRRDHFPAVVDAVAGHLAMMVIENLHCCTPAAVKDRTPKFSCGVADPVGNGEGCVLAVPLPIFGSLGHILYYRISWKLFPIDPTRPVYNEIGYYRVVAETMVDDEALKLDVVVRCVEQKLPGRYRHLRIPYLYGLRTKGNHTVIMHTPDLCYSIEQVGQPPKALARFAEDYLPLMFWGENADDLEEFTAYTAEAAYTHQKARMTRPKVRAMVATAAEYAAWQRVFAAKNILLSVPRDPFGSDYDLPPVWPKGMPVPVSANPHLPRIGDPVPPVLCHGMLKLPLSEGHKEGCTSHGRASRPRRAKVSPV